MKNVESGREAPGLNFYILHPSFYIRLMPRWLSNWLARHRNPTSFWLHMVGIPMTIAAIPLATVQLIDDRWDLWWRPAALFVGGYFLQWVGHLIEGNDMGELILIKKLRGKPYVAISPRYARPGDQV